MEKDDNISMIEDMKKGSKEYLLAIEKFLDIASNIEDEDLKKRLIFAMLKCDTILSKIAEEELNKK